MSHSVALAVATALALSATALSNTARAADTTADPLDEVVVTATRSATPQSQLAVPVIVIDRAAIEASLAGDAAALLTGLPGVEIARSGGPGQPASVFLRGTDSNHTLVLVDGVAINPGTIGGAALQNIAPENIERIEIVKGARATLYGNSAIGGVINIITRADSATGVGASISGGSYDTRAASASVGTALDDDLHLGVSVAWRDSDGFPSYRSVPEDRGYDNTSLNASLRYTASEQLTLTARGWRASGNTEYTGYDANFALTGLDEDYRNASYSGGAEWHSGDTGLHALLTHSEDLLQQNQSSDNANTRRNALDLGGAWVLPYAQTLSAGALLSHEQTDALSYGTGYDVSTDVWQVYAQDQLKFQQSNLLLAVAHTHHETFGAHNTWNAELTQPLNDTTTLTAAAGTAFRAPDSTDRFGYGGTPDLKPEQSKQYEVGLRQRLDAYQLVSVNAFINHIDNLIDFDYSTYTEQNIDRASIRGVELQYQAHAGNWHGQAQLTVQRARDPDADTDLLRRARRYGSLSVGQDVQRVQWNAEWQISGARPDYGDVRLGGYGLLNLTAGVKLADEWSLQLAVNNAFDHDYELASGYDTGGRSVNLALRYRAN
ncbi:MAG: TonB-dependent receptor [Steroidobacteraceae bacterium]